MSERELTAKIKELREMQRVAEEATALAEAIKDEIKAIMGVSEELCAGEYKITWKPVKSSRFDTAAFRKAMPELAAAFTKESTTRRFVVA